MCEIRKKTEAAFPPRREGRGFRAEYLMNEKYSAFDLLEGDYQGNGLRTLQETLSNLQMSVRRTMDQGLPSEDFALAKKVLLAVETAKETANALHDKMAE